MAQVDVTRIASNIGALNALNSLQNINQKLAMHQTRLSTGRRINSAADDPAGLTIATKMLARSEGMKVAGDNIGDALNMLAVAESGLSKMNDILVIMRNKAEQAASDTLGSSERNAIATQLSAFASQIDSMVAETKWNGTQLLDGTVNKRFQTGVDDGEYTRFQLASKFDPGTLGISTSVLTDAAALGSGVSISDSNSIAQIDQVDNFDGLSQFVTGTYNVNILEAAVSSSQGRFVGTGTPVAPAGLTVATRSQASTVGELTTGAKSLLFTGYTAGTNLLTYTLTQNGADTTGHVTIAANSTTGAATTTSLNGTGITLLGTGATTATTDAYWSGVVADPDVADKTVTFDYLKSDTVKFEVRNGSNEVQSIDADGLSTATATATSAYANFADTFDTGRGVEIEFDPAPVAGRVGHFTYARQNLYSVDVSTADVASSYMETVNTAMDTVNESLASLGSLMARLSYKAEQTANAQVNIEGAYSRIMNANMAEEQMNASKYTILQQTAVAMLAQANQAPQSLLTLFR